MKSIQFSPVRKLAAVAIVTLGATAVCTSVSSAGTTAVDFSSNTNMRGLGSFSGTATLDSSTDLLTVVMTNMSKRGYLYGLAFDLEGGENAKDMTNDGKHGFKSVGKNGVAVRPFGRYEAGAIDSTSNRHSLAAGATKTLVFQISGAPAGMTAFDLLDNPDGESIVGTFRGFKHSKKDHAAAVVIPVTPAVIGGSTVNSDPTSGSGGTIVQTKSGSSNPAGNTSTGGTSTGGTIHLPGEGDQTPTAIPLPSAAVSGMTTLALMAIVAGKRKLAGMIN